VDRDDGLRAPGELARDVVGVQAQVSGAMSAKTGTAPTVTTALAVAMKL
jgi:hypothetical protein